jgi:hypothetical protein
MPSEACEAYIKSQAHEGWRLDRRSEREIEERLLPVAERFEAALDGEARCRAPRLE